MPLTVIKYNPINVKKIFFFLKIEKKPCTTDPQILLNNLDDVHLNELLCVVHGPE